MASGNSIEVSDPNTLGHLDDFSLLSIFDLLSFRDLMNMATLGPRFSQLISHHYIIGKYHLDECKLELTAVKEVYLRYKCDDTGNKFKFGDGYDETILALRSFCHIFDELKITMYDIETEIAEGLSYYVSSYCGKIHQEIESTPRMLEKMNISPMNVTNVKLSGLWSTREVKEFRMDLAFPRVAKLEIDSLMNLSYQYPHLTEFKLRSRYVDFDDLLGFMQLNPQLRKIQLPFFNNGTFLSIMNELLPNLETLAFYILNGLNYSYFDTIKATRFRNVKAFAIRSYISEDPYYMNDIQKMLSSIQFERLESFDVTTYQPQTFDFFIGWITRNTGLTTVSIYYSGLSSRQWSALIAPLTKLQVLEITAENESFDVLNAVLASDVAHKSLLKQITINIPFWCSLTRANICENVLHGWRCNQDDAVKTPVQLFRAI